FHFSAEHIVQAIALAVDRCLETRLNGTVHITVGVDLVRVGLTGQCFSQHNVHNLVTTNVQIGRAATDQFNTVNLAGGDTGQLGIGFVGLAGHTFAVDQNLVTTATTQTTVGVGGTEVTRHRGAQTRNTVQHVQSRYRGPLLEVGLGINNIR